MEDKEFEPLKILYLHFKLIQTPKLTRWFISKLNSYNTATKSKISV